MAKNGLSPDFVPAFFDELDGRFSLKKEIRHRLDRLKEDAGVDSYQKELLAKEAVFLALQLETMRVKALAQESNLDSGVYTQMVNALSGLLTKLGLNRQIKPVQSLRDYVEGKAR